LRQQSYLFCVVIQTTFWELCNCWFTPNLATKRSTVSRRWIRKDIYENCHFRSHLPPKSEIESRSNRHLTQSRLQVTGCTAERYCLLHIVVQGPGSFHNRSTFLYDVRLRSYKVAQFSNFGLFPTPYKNPKTYLLVTSLQPRGYIAEWLRFFHVVVEGPKGCLLVREFSCDFWYWSWDTQTCPNFRLWQMANSYTHAECYYMARQIWTKDAWKRTILRMDVLSHQVSSPFPKNHPKTSFWGTFQCNTYYSST